MRFSLVFCFGTALNKNNWSLQGGKRFEVSRKYANISKLVENALEGDQTATDIPVPGVADDILGLVSFCSRALIRCVPQQFVAGAHYICVVDCQLHERAQGRGGEAD